MDGLDTTVGQNYWCEGMAFCARIALPQEERSALERDVRRVRAAYWAVEGAVLATLGSGILCLVLGLLCFRAGLREALGSVVAVSFVFAVVLGAVIECVVCFNVNSRLYFLTALCVGVVSDLASTSIQGSTGEIMRTVAGICLMPLVFVGPIFLLARWFDGRKIVPALTRIQMDFDAGEVWEFRDRPPWPGQPAPDPLRIFPNSSLEYRKDSPLGLRWLLHDVQVTAQVQPRVLEAPVHGIRRELVPPSLDLTQRPLLESERAEICALLRKQGRRAVPTFLLSLYLSALVCRALECIAWESTDQGMDGRGWWAAGITAALVVALFQGRLWLNLRAALGDGRVILLRHPGEGDHAVVEFLKTGRGLMAWSRDGRPAPYRGIPRR